MTASDRRKLKTKYNSTRGGSSSDEEKTIKQRKKRPLQHYINKNKRNPSSFFASASGRKTQMKKRQINK